MGISWCAADGSQGSYRTGIEKRYQDHLIRIVCVCVSLTAWQESYKRASWEKRDGQLKEVPKHGKKLQSARIPKSWKTRLWLKPLIKHRLSRLLYAALQNWTKERAVGAWGGKFMEKENNVHSVVDKAVSPLSSCLTFTQHWGEGGGDVLLFTFDRWENRSGRVSD